MPLPKISHPTFVVDLPSTKQKITCRPMLSREEKILLIAKQSDLEADKLAAIRQVVNNCVIDKIEIDKIALFDLEWMFLKIRSQSVSNSSKVYYRDGADDKVRDFDVNLDLVTVKFPENDATTIKVNDRIIIKMKYPPASLFTDAAIVSNQDENALSLLIARCVDKVFEGENVTVADQVPEKEMVEFLEGLDIPTYNKIREFIATIPHLNYEIEYVNDNGDQRKITLTSLADFFGF